MSDRNINFYIELVFATVITLVAGSMWIEWLKHMLNHYFPEHLNVALFIAGLLLTLLAILGLKWLLTLRQKPKSHFTAMEVPNTDNHDRRRSGRY